MIPNKLSNESAGKYIEFCISNTNKILVFQTLIKYICFFFNQSNLAKTQNPQPQVVEKHGDLPLKTHDAPHATKNPTNETQINKSSNASNETNSNEDLAAVKIQSVYRGFKTRHELKNVIFDISFI